MSGMTEWDEIGCRRGCAEHPTRVVDVKLGGPTAYKDLTPIPERFACEFQIEVWDTDQMPVDVDPLWCPAHDAVSETILSLGVWEPQNTTVLMLAWEAVGDSCVFLDIGMQLGWFSQVAGALGTAAVGVEADPTVVGLLENQDLPVIHERIGPGWFLGGELVGGAQVVVKIDIEGAEEHAVNGLMPLIVDGLVPFIMMEVSPCFNDSYPHLVAELIIRGYEAYRMPPKRNPPVVIDQLADLIPYRLDGNVDEVMATVASWHQEDLFFALGGIEP